jgi:D-hydroxyproline dehydrogenase subunit alpha
VPIADAISPLSVDVAVVGSGPAGLAAALAAAESGLTVSLIDERPAAGGQYLVGNDVGQSAAVAATERLGAYLLRQVVTAGIDWRLGSTVWDLDSRLTLRLFSHGQATALKTRAVVLACGAREQVIPFPGWTLPGVMTAGAAQLLAKRYGVLPGKRVVLAGSGPLLLATAARLAALGAHVAGIVEASHPRMWLPHARAAWGHGDRFSEAWEYLGTLRRGRVPYRFGQAVVAASGEEKLERVTIARLDAAGRPLAEGCEDLAVDALCVSFGLLPNTELAQLGGARLLFDPRRGGWVPDLDTSLQTTVPGLFVAGEAASIAGAAAAMSAGRLAGLAAARHLDSIPADAFEPEKARLEDRLRREARFGITLNTLFAPPPGLDTIITGDTFVCRCEEVTAGEVTAAIANCGDWLTLDSLKIWTRVGQGPCQGRTCAPILGRLISRETGRPIADAGTFAARPPVRPVPLHAIAAMERTDVGVRQ